MFVKTTKAQRKAIWKLYARAFLTGEGLPVKSYKSFRKTVQPTIACDNAVVVPWAGMFVCIETDGYTHT